MASGEWEVRVAEIQVKMEARKAEERESRGGSGRGWSVAEQRLRADGMGAGEGAAVKGDAWAPCWSS